MSKCKYTDEELIDAIKTSYSYTEVCKKIGVSYRKLNIDLIKDKILKLGIDTSHFTGQRWNKGRTSYDHSSIKRRDITEVLSDKFKFTSSYVRRRLLKEHIKEYKCECCKRTEWMGIPIPLELHHINGNHYDNRLENLLILCPNCHALTDTHLSIEEIKILINEQQIKGHELQNELVKIYNNKKTEKDKNKSNIKKIKDKKTKVKVITPKYRDSGKRPDIITLIKDLKEIKTFTGIGKKYQVSDNTVRKWCKTYGILDKLNNIDDLISNLK